MARKHRRHPQHSLELRKLAEWIKEAKSILEIGCRYGDNLVFMAGHMAGKRIVGVDLPDAEGWNDPQAGEILLDTVKAMKDSELDAHLIIGNSTHPDCFSRVFDLGPYDVIFIDGDHSYNGVKMDWQIYHTMGKQIIFHDINPINGLGVSKFWEELKKDSKNFKLVEEFIADDSKMGLGRIVR